MTRSDARLALIEDWLSRELRLAPQRIEPASSDASFRRYFRVFGARGTWIVMDAPPEKEDVRPYLKVALLLEDLGTTLYLDRLSAGVDPQPLYGDALAALSAIQVRGAAASRELPPYDSAALGRELALMPEWFLARHLGLEATPAEGELIAQT